MIDKQKNKTHNIQHAIIACFGGCYDTLVQKLTNLKIETNVRTLRQLRIVVFR